MSGVDVEALVVELRECRADFDCRIMPDHCEPIGIDCGVLRRAEEAITALLAKSAAYDALVADAERYRYARARCLDGSKAKEEAAEALRNASTETEFDAAFDLAIELDRKERLLVQEGGDGN